MSNAIRINILVDANEAQARAAGASIAKQVEAGIVAGMGRSSANLQRLFSNMGIPGAGVSGAAGGAGAGALNRQLKTTRQLFQQIMGGGQSTLRAITYGLTSAASATYLLRSGLHSIRALLLDPALRSFRLFANITDDSRKFEIAMMRLTGGLDRARQLNRLLQTSNSPLSTRELREASQALGYTPALSGRISRNTPVGAAMATEQFGELIAKLNLIDPKQAQQNGAVIGIREALEGDLISLRRRYGISSKTLARLVSMDLQNLTQDRGAILESVQRWADLFISDEAVQKSSQLIETRLEKLRDAGRLAMDRLAETGLYDSISARLGRARTGILDYIQSGRFDSAANRVGGNVDSILDNLGSAARALAKGLTGHESADGIAALGDAAVALSEHLKTLSAVLPTVAGGFGSLVRELSVVVDLAANAAGLIDNVNKRADQTRQALVNSRGGLLEWRLGVGGMPEHIAQRQAIEALHDKAYRRPPMTDDAAADLKAWDAWEARRREDLARMRSAVGTAAMRWDSNAGQFLPQFENPAWVARLLDSSGLLAAGHVLRRDSGLLEPRQERRSRFPASLAAEIQREGALPAFQPSAQELASSLDPLSRLADRRGSILSSLTDGAGALGAANPRKLIDDLRTMRDERGAQMITALADGYGALAGNPFDRELQAYAGQVRNNLVRLRDSFNETVTGIADNLVEHNQNYGQVLAGELDRLAPHLAAEMAERLSAGTTALADEIAAVLRYAGRGVADRTKALGLQSLPIDVQQQIVTSGIRGRLQSIDDARLYGMLTPGMSVEQIEAARKARYSGTGAAAAAHGYIRDSALPWQAGVLERAQKAAAKNPDDLVALATAEDAVHKYAELLHLQEQLRQESNLTARAMAEFSIGVRNALDQGAGDAITGLIMGMNNLRDVARAVAADIIRAFSQSAANSLMTGLLGDFGRPQRDGSIGAGGGLFGGLLGSLFGFADGGAFHRGRVIPFAQGGVVDKATLFGMGGGNMGVMGEAGPEAVLPLQRGGDGKLGVKAAGSGGGVRIYNVLNMEQAFAQGYRAHRGDILNDLTGEVRKTGKLGRAVRQNRAG